MKIPIFCLLGILLCTAETCEKTEAPEQAALQEAIAGLEPCAPAKKAVKEVVDVKGQIGFDATSQQYFIQRGIPGSYDSVDIGMICGAVPTSLRRTGITVLFSGVYKEYDQPLPTPVTVGTKFYYLELTKAQI